MDDAGSAAPANAVPTVTLVSGDPAEEQAGWQLLRLLERYDLRKWQFTDAIQIDRTAIPHSKPVLTLNARYLHDDNRALATYLHEQLHWFAISRGAALHRAMQELRERFPSVPPYEAGGARDDNSTYLHLVVCPLEYAALTEVIGQDAAQTTLERADFYTWIYATTLCEWDYFADLLRRNDLVVPDAPAIPEPGATRDASPPQPGSDQIHPDPAAIEAFSLQLYVLDLYASADFYIRALGFSVQYTRPLGLSLGRPASTEAPQPSLQYVFLHNGFMFLGLNPLSALPANHHLRRNPEAPRGLGSELLLVVNDADAAERRVREAGFPIESQRQDRPWGGSDFRVLDPDGYSILVVSRR